MAELAHAWSGQDRAWFADSALAVPEEWSLARLFRRSYVTDPTLNGELYGLGGLLLEPLRESVRQIGRASCRERV